MPAAAGGAKTGLPRDGQHLAQVSKDERPAQPGLRYRRIETTSEVLILVLERTGSGWSPSDKMSLEDVDRVLGGSFLFLLDGPPCVLRETLLDSVRTNLMELDALDRNHPVWAFLAVQTVNRSRLGSFLGWKIYHGLADERVYWANMARDLAAGSRVSTEAWSRLETLSPAWRFEWALLQGFFNFHLFSPGKWMEELKGYLERRDLVEPALAYLRQPALVDEPCVRWLTPGATRQGLIEYAEAIEVVIPA